MSDIKRHFVLTREKTALVVIDIQDKLIPAMPPDSIRSVLENSQILIKAGKLFNLPILATEQYPGGLGKTYPDIMQALEYQTPMEKLVFSSYRQPDFRRKLEENGIRNIILCGIETHVCVYQTVLDLLANQYQVYAAGDAMCSRTLFNHQTGLQLMREAGAVVGSTETFLFQMLQSADSPIFKDFLRLVK